MTVHLNLEYETTSFSLFSIDGKQRALPTLNIFTESRASLKELQLMTYKMLEIQ